MKTLPKLAQVMSLALPGLLLADPVNETQVITFQAGQPACAADMNQTVQALIAAVNDNAARIAELEAQLRRAQRPLSAKVLGSSYQIYSYEAGLGEVSTTQNVGGPGSIVANTHGKLGHSSFIETGTLVLNIDGTASLTASSFEREVYMDTFATHDANSPAVPDIPG